MDASSNTAAITQTAIQDVTRFLDRTEKNLRSLAQNPYINTRHYEEAMVVSGNISSMTQGVEDDVPVHVRIPHRCAVNREYRLRPRPRQLDWIISTNPLHVQPITPGEHNSEFRGGPTEPRIFDTSNGKWRRRYLGKKKSKNVLSGPLSASPSTAEENVVGATELDSNLTSAPGEPRIFDKSTGKWRRRYLGKKKSKNVLSEPLSVSPSTAEENVVSATELDSSLMGVPGEPRIFDKSTGKWRRRYLGKKKGEDVPSESSQPLSSTVKEIVATATELNTEIRSAQSAPSSAAEEIVGATELDSSLMGVPGEPRIFDKSTGKWRRRYLGKKKGEDVPSESSQPLSSTVKEIVATATELNTEIRSAQSAPSSAAEEIVGATELDSNLTGAPGEPLIFDKSTGKWRRRYLGKKKGEDVPSESSQPLSSTVKEIVATATELNTEIRSAQSAPSSAAEEIVGATELDSNLTGAPGEPLIFDKSTGKWRRRYLGKKKGKDVLSEPSQPLSSTVKENVATATELNTEIRSAQSSAPSSAAEEVATATELDSNLTGAPGEPLIFDKSTGKWRRRYLGKKKGKDVPSEPSQPLSSAVEENVATATELNTETRSAQSPAPSSAVKENGITATDLDSNLTGTRGEPRIFDKSSGKWRRRYLGKKKGKDVPLEPSLVPSPTGEENGRETSTGLISNSNEFPVPNNSNKELETKKRDVTPPSSRDLVFGQSLRESNQYKFDVEADLLKTAQELEQIGLKALSEIELAKTAWGEKMNVGVGSRVKVVDVSTASSEDIGGKEIPNTAQPLTASNPLASEMKMQQAQVSCRKRLRRPSLAEVEIPKDLSSEDFVSPKSSNISDLTQTSLLTSHADDEESKKNISRKSDIKSDNTPYRRRRLPRPFQSDVSMLANKIRLKARLRMRAKAARIRERKRLSKAANDADECRCSPRLTPFRNILDGNEGVIKLEPLKAPISVDSSRIITRCDEQINLTQILRIYGSGDVEEPYEIMPQRLARTRIRGALANVLCGTNMIEIRLTNTAIHSARRGQVNNWIFTHDEDVHTTPVVFAKTVLVQDHPPAPFCLSVASPFWVSIYQEQVASSKGGERFRDCVEVRSCKGSDMPCFEMSSLQREVHPLFKERIYLGKGVIRIERNVDLPSERESSEYFSNSTRVASRRQYRIKLPWRQIEDQPETGIPRAPQLTEIHTTYRPHICITNEQQNKPYRKTRPQKAATSSSAITSPITSTSSYFNDNASNSLSEAWSAPKNKGSSHITEHSTAIHKEYKEPPVLRSPQELYSEAVRSRAPQITDELSKGDTLPISPTQESLEEASHDTSISPTQDSVVEALQTTYAGEETGEAATSTVSTNTSAGTTSSLGIFEYGVELEGSQNDIVTALALPPVLLHIRRRKGEPLKNTGSVSYKYAAAKRKSMSSRAHSRSSNAGKSKLESENRRLLVDELADNLYAGDVIVHEKLADNTLKLQLHLTSKLKDASKEEEDARFLPDRITVQGNDVWSGI